MRPMLIVAAIMETIATAIGNGFATWQVSASASV